MHTVRALTQRSLQAVIPDSVCAVPLILNCSVPLLLVSLLQFCLVFLFPGPAEIHALLVGFLCVAAMLFLQRQ